MVYWPLICFAQQALWLDNHGNQDGGQQATGDAGHESVAFDQICGLAGKVRGERPDRDGVRRESERTSTREADQQLLKIDSVFPDVNQPSLFSQRYVLLSENRNVVNSGVRVVVTEIDIARPDTLLIRHHLHLCGDAEFLVVCVPSLHTGDNVDLV